MGFLRFMIAEIGGIRATLIAAGCVPIVGTLVAILAFFIIQLGRPFAIGVYVTCAGVVLWALRRATRFVRKSLHAYRIKQREEQEASFDALARRL